MALKMIGAFVCMMASILVCGGAAAILAEKITGEDSVAAVCAIISAVILGAPLGILLMRVFGLDW